MKMSKEDYNQIIDAFEANKDEVISHYNYIQSVGKYNILENRVAWDCLRAFVDRDFISEQYALGLNDNHITTASVKALKQVLGV